MGVCYHAPIVIAASSMLWELYIILTDIESVLSVQTDWPAASKAKYTDVILNNLLLLWMQAYVALMYTLYIVLVHTLRVALVHTLCVVLVHTLNIVLGHTLFSPGTYSLCSPGTYTPCSPGIYTSCSPGIYTPCSPGTYTLYTPAMQHTISTQTRCCPMWAWVDTH